MSARCPACGTVYTDDASFCSRDGTRLVNAAGVVPTPVASAVIGGDARATVPRTSPPPLELIPVADPAALAGMTLDGRYRVERKVGEGGMSYVYLANDVTDGTRVAIKVLSPALAADRNAMARLRREAGLAIRLAHPNVCHIMRLGETEDGLVYVVMPFVEGEILADRRFRERQMPLRVVVRFVEDIAAGLDVAHQLGIIHRDLKPENVMICRAPDGTDRAVVMDFGLAKERQAGRELEKLTATGIILGTPEFMSPEQLRGKPLDPRTDVYSLALMTFEMLTGKLPFEGRNQQEMMIARLRSEPRTLSESRPDLHFPAAVEKVLLKGMARDADDRHARAPEFAAALAEAAASDGGSAGGGGGFIKGLFGR